MTNPGYQILPLNVASYIFDVLQPEPVIIFPLTLPRQELVISTPRWPSDRNTPIKVGEPDEKCSGVRVGYLDAFSNEFVRSRLSKLVRSI